MFVRPSAICLSGPPSPSARPPVRHGHRRHRCHHRCPGHATDGTISRITLFRWLTRVATIVTRHQGDYPGIVVMTQAIRFRVIRSPPTLPGSRPAIPIRIEAGRPAREGTPRNHDFRLGPRVMPRRWRARLPLRDGKSTSCRRHFALQAIRARQRQGVRIGITGFTTPGPRVESRPASGQAPLARIRRPHASGAAPARVGPRCGSGPQRLAGPASYDTAGTGVRTWRRRWRG